MTFTLPMPFGEDVRFTDDAVEGLVGQRVWLTIPRHSEMVDVIEAHGDHESLTVTIAASEEFRRRLGVTHDEALYVSMGDPCSSGS